LTKIPKIGRLGVSLAKLRIIQSLVSIEKPPKNLFLFIS